LREYIIKGFTLDDERPKQAGEPSPVEQRFVKMVNEVKVLEKIKNPKNTRKKRKETQ